MFCRHNKVYNNKLITQNRPLYRLICLPMVSIFSPQKSISSHLENIGQTTHFVVYEHPAEHVVEWPSVAAFFCPDISGTYSYDKNLILIIFFCAIFITYFCIKNKKKSKKYQQKHKKLIKNTKKYSNIEKNCRTIFLCAQKNDKNLKHIFMVSILPMVHFF